MPESASTPEQEPETALTLGPEAAGVRLDQALQQRLPGRSRSFISALIKDSAILVDGHAEKSSRKMKGGEKIEIEWPEPEVIEARPENIPLRILYEDRDMAVIHKPAGMAAHPSAGHGSGTLVHALLWHCKDLSGINGSLRPGIVHRLDKDTSGAIVTAKNDATHQALQEQFAARSVQKKYLALCHGSPPQDNFFCDGRLGRHPTKRTEQTVLRDPQAGREAYTGFEVLWRGKLKTLAGEGTNTPIFLVRALPKTGRTHQIRVHLAKAGFPILCDGLYGKESALSELGLARHALHAWSLSIDHPREKKRMTFVAPPDADLKGALEKLGIEVALYAQA